MRLLTSLEWLSFSRAFVAVALLAMAPAASAQDASAELPSTLTAFAALKRDPAPDALVRDTHYWISNENRLELFHDDVKDVGGVYIGVGTDQNYLLAGWANPDALVLMDFDQGVVDLHLVYRALFMHFERRADFVDAWTKKNKKKTRQVVTEFYKDDKRRRRRARWAFGQARWAVERRFGRVLKHMAKVEKQTFLDDDAQYARVRQLFVDGKVFALRGDLTKRRAMSSIAKAVEASGLEVGTLYLSNAEQYFKFDWAFRKNMAQLPFAERSVVLRTSGLRSLKRVKGTYYHYNIQDGRTLQAWLVQPKQKRARSAVRLLRYAVPTDVRGFTRLTLPPHEARAAYKQRRAEAKQAARDKWKKKRKGRKKRSSKKTPKNTSKKASKKAAP